ncbi:uncharacterized protein LOC134189032 isoform X2 [Corticium candelabrum]|uniref:uncharacterized protein LOC134189032 isoform X2 n=1 Tax=Corticium candelabrum TaxID=121492 RepID=UPI002E26E7A9|nr:uncharacterized protein LOC134189032 isoform X2 [Corticium candelabrum]
MVERRSHGAKHFVRQTEESCLKTSRSDGMHRFGSSGFEYGYQRERQSSRSSQASSGRGSGIEIFGTVGMGREDMPPKQSEFTPENCRINESVSVLIDLPSSNGLFLADDRCKLILIGLVSKRRVFKEGTKRNHNYGIRASFPVWFFPETVEVVVLTLDGMVLGWGRFEFLPSERTLPVAVSVDVQINKDRRTVDFVRKVLASSTVPSSSPNVALKFPVQGSTYSFHVCLPQSDDFLTNLFDSVMGFVVANGIPEGISVVDMFSNVPDLRKVLESSRYSGGAVTHLLDYVRSQSRHESVIQQFEELVEKSIDEDGAYIDLTRERASHERVDGIYDDPNDILPSRTGLELPDKVASTISSDFGKHVLESVRNGAISDNKAIEMVRDIYNTSLCTAGQPSPSTQVQQKGRKQRSHSVFYIPLQQDGTEIEGYLDEITTRRSQQFKKSVSATAFLQSSPNVTESPHSQNKWRGAYESASQGSSPVNEIISLTRRQENAYNAVCTHGIVDQEDIYHISTSRPPLPNRPPLPPKTTTRMM